MELPENYLVKLDVEKRNKKNPVIMYLNEKYDNGHDGTALWYGEISGDSTYYNSSNAREDLPKKATILTQQEFENIINNKESNYQIY